VNPRDVQRGYADLAKLHTAAEAWQSVAQRLAVVEGSSQLTVAQVRAQARRAMRQHQSERCLVVVDYGYQRKAGHFIASMTYRHGRLPLAGPGQLLDLG
jgi:replicative DNA helicase